MVFQYYGAVESGIPSQRDVITASTQVRIDLLGTKALPGRWKEDPTQLALLHPADPNLTALSVY